jgi:hypothetical protein
LTRANRRRATVLCITALLAVNAWIVARLFKTEFTPFMGSIEGAYVGISRWVIAHGMNARWFPLWYGGIPSRNSYPPLLHWLVAGWSWATGMTVPHSHHVVTAAFYCAAPPALFLLTLRLSGSHWKAFLAGMFYSLVSPSPLLMSSVHFDLGSLWYSRKIHTLIVYGDGPHIASITLLLFALAAIDNALECEWGWWTVAAVVLSSLVALTNWLGSMSLALGSVALLLAKKKNNFGRLLLIGALAYGLAMPWIPPSDLATVAMNAQLLGGYMMGASQYVYLVLWAGMAVAVAWGLRKTALAEGSRFAILFLLLVAIPPLGYEWFHVYPLPQPDRYQLEMEAAMAIVLGVALGSRRFVSASGLKRCIVPISLCALAVVQIPRWRKQMRGTLPHFDITNTIERTEALWLQSHFPGQRVFVPGSARFWLNAFADNPQLSGGFDQGRPSREIIDVTYAVPKVPGKGAEAVALLEAYGVRAVAVGGPKSRNVYRDYEDPQKFNGILPERWRDGDDVIYEVPGDGSLVHVVPAADLVTTGLPDSPAIKRFAAALEQSPPTALKWSGTDRAAIQTRVPANHVVSLQITWDPGWRATVNGESLPVERDKLGLIILRPRCENGCTVNLVYTGGTEAAVSDIVFGASFLLCGFLVYRGRRNAAHAVPATESRDGIAA